VNVFRKTVFGFGFLMGVLLLPPVFDRFFSMVRLLDLEKPYLWMAALLLILASLYCLLGRRHAIGVSFVLLNLLLLMSVELSARVAVKIFMPEKVIRLSQWGNMSYDHLRVYRAHPFLQFTGASSTQLIGNEALGDLSEFNNFGFVGEDFVYKKPAEVIRIAALGASTTASGYPAMLESYLNDELAGSQKQIEVMNFGLGFYTTANTLVNFALNVVSFAPDIIIIHHGWNDCHVRAEPDVFRSDYSHHLKAFEPPRFVADRYILRTSVIYRALKFMLGPPNWAFIGAAAQVPRDIPSRPMNARELETFERNLEQIIHLAAVNQVEIILTTLPRTTDAAKPSFEDHVCLDQFNEVTRKLARHYQASLRFLDLAAILDDKLDSHFRDLAHLSKEGRRIKALALGHMMLPNLKRPGSPASALARFRRSKRTGSNSAPSRSPQHNSHHP